MGTTSTYSWPYPDPTDPVANGAQDFQDLADAAEATVSGIDYLATNAQTASYTLVLSDAGKIVEVSNAAANTLTVPPNSSVAFPVGTQVIVIQTGAGQATLTAGAGVTINSKDADLAVNGQWAAATLIKRATDSWIAIGDLTT